MRHLVANLASHLRHISRLWCLTVQEWHKQTHLEHVHELLVKCLAKHTEVVCITIKDLQLVLVDEERDSDTTFLDLLHLLGLTVLISRVEVGRWIDAS